MLVATPRFTIVSVNDRTSFVAMPSCPAASATPAISLALAGISIDICFMPSAIFCSCSGVPSTVLYTPVTAVSNSIDALTQSAIASATSFIAFASPPATIASDKTCIASAPPSPASLVFLPNSSMLVAHPSALLFASSRYSLVSLIWRFSSVSVAFERFICDSQLLTLRVAISYLLWAVSSSSLSFFCSAASSAILSAVPSDDCLSSSISFRTASSLAFRLSTLPAYVSCAFWAFSWALVSSCVFFFCISYTFCRAFSFASSASVVFACSANWASASFNSELILRSSAFIDVIAFLNSASPSITSRVVTVRVAIVFSSFSP